MPLETLSALNYNSFILTVGIIGVDSHARDMYGNSHSQGICVLLEIPSMHKLVQYFQSLYTCRNEDIYTTFVMADRSGGVGTNHIRARQVRPR